MYQQKDILYLLGEGVKAGCGLNGVEPNRSCPNVRVGLSTLLLMFVRRAAFGGGATRK